MKNGLLYFLLCLAALVSSCDGTNTRYHIGVSQCSDDEWRHKMNKEMQREALFYDGVQVEFRTAKDNNQYQINDINYFIDRKVKGLFRPDQHRGGLGPLHAAGTVHPL